MLSPKDQEQLARQGIKSDKLNWQLNIFRKGIPFTILQRAAVPGDGILQISDSDKERFIKKFASAMNVIKMKFIPASGAASRMFKALFEYAEKNLREDVPSDGTVKQFFASLKSFAFYEDLATAAEKNGKSLDTMLKSNQYIEILRLVLDEEGLNYGFLPKGLLKFHRYEKSTRTPFEEHLVEAALYVGTEGRSVKLHYTVSPEHMDSFRELLNRVRNTYEKRFGLRYDVEFSIQEPSTDTIAVDLENEPFRNDDGTLLFRPGGHGALINNLNELDADIIFIKNIDNVVPEKYLESTVTFKKILGGKLLETQGKVFNLLRELDSEEPTVDRLREMYDFIRIQLNYEFAIEPDLNDITNTARQFHAVLNRPIRVCGVVKNLGEPGGGPYWAPNSAGDITLQIIESSQVDKENETQTGIFNQATHFNPVDLVCAVKSYKGKKFHLPDYVDGNTCFISQKSKDGKELKALELPGLWNGAMADWITIFVEVPIETFNPVKTIIDLLRPEHQ